MNGGDYELAYLGAGIFVLSLAAIGAGLLVARGRRRLAVPGAVPGAGVPASPTPLDPRWCWVCCACDAVLQPGPDPEAGVNFGYCRACLERWRLRGEAARRAARTRRNGHG